MSLPPPVPYTRVDPKSTDHRPVLGWRCPPLEPPSLLYSRSRCSSMRLRGMQRALHPAWSPEELLSLLQIYEGSPGIAVFARDVARAIGLNIEDAEVRVLLADRPEHSSPPCLLRGVLPKNHQCNAFCLDPLRALLMGASVRAYKSVGNLSPYLPPLSTPPIQCIAATQTPQPPIAVCASTQTATCSYRLVPLPVSSATQTPAQCDSNRRTISTQTPPARSYTIRILMPVQPLLVIRVLSPVTAVSQSLRFLPSPHVGAAPPRSVPALTLNSDHRQDLADIRALALPSMVSPLAAPPSYSGGEERPRKVARVSCSHFSPHLPAPSARTPAVWVLSGRMPQPPESLVASHPLFSRRHWRSPHSSVHVLSKPSAALV
jgi:hypothetical protein